MSSDARPSHGEGKRPRGRPKSKNKPPAAPKKQKMYEIRSELSDPNEEKRRLNSINAKKNRDRKKMEKKALNEQLAIVTAALEEERDRADEAEKRAETASALLAAHGIAFP